MPVARSRPRARWTPISSIAAAASTSTATNPHSGADADQVRGGAAGGADVAERLAGERLPPHHREDADHAGDDRHRGADRERHVDRFVVEEARARRSTRSRLTAPPRTSRRAGARVDGLLAAVQVGVVARAGDDQHPPVDVEHVDVVAVEPAEDVGADDLLGWCRWPRGRPRGRRPGPSPAAAG